MPMSGIFRSIVMFSLLQVLAGYILTICRGQESKQVIVGQDNWRIDEWEQLDDVQGRPGAGGTSESKLVINTDGNLIFSGKVTTMPLGGAGFASQLLRFNPSTTLQDYDGISFDIVNQSQFTFSVNILKPSTERRGCSYKAKVDPQGPRKVFFKWSDFEANFRGNPDLSGEQCGPLDLSKITEFSIMAQSFFDEQSGSFEWVLKEIALYKEWGFSSMTVY